MFQIVLFLVHKVIAKWVTCQLVTGLHHQSSSLLLHNSGPLKGATRRKLEPVIDRDFPELNLQEDLSIAP